MLLSTLWFSLYSIRNLQETLDLQVHTRTVIITLKDNLTALLNAETGERGYVITGEDRYLEPYTASKENIAYTIQQLRFLTKNSSDQQLNMDTLELLISEKLKYIEEIISLKKNHREAEVTQLLIIAKGKLYMDQIRYLNHTMRLQEEKQFAERQVNTEKSINNARLIFIAQALFSILITLFLTIMIFRELSRRNKVERKLHINNIELHRKNKEIEQFAYIASHDLQEPLRSISNFSALLSAKLKSNPDSAVTEYMNIIVNGTKRMSNLIFDMLEYSRIGKDAEKKEINCAQLVNEIMADMDVLIKENNAKVEMGKLPVVKALPYLKSLFQNLISNAIKFRKSDESPVIKISAKEYPLEYIFTISDNGIGIEKDYYERIFLMFQRLHSRAEYAGTGIGLAQCKKIVELNGGRIWVESEPGKGSNFIFTVPK